MPHNSSARRSRSSSRVTVSFSLTVGSGSERLVNVHQGKTHLSQLLQEVKRGQEVVNARSGVPIARLGACFAHPHRSPVRGVLRSYPPPGGSR